MKKLPSLKQVLPQPIVYIPSGSESSPKTTKLATPIIPTTTFSLYLDAWKFTQQTGCKRKIKKIGWNEYVV